MLRNDSEYVGSTPASRISKTSTRVPRSCRRHRRWACGSRHFTRFCPTHTPAALALHLTPGLRAERLATAPRTARSGNLGACSVESHAPCSVKSLVAPTLPTAFLQQMVRTQGALDCRPPHSRRRPMRRAPPLRIFPAPIIRHRRNVRGRRERRPLVSATTISLEHAVERLETLSARRRGHCRLRMNRRRRAALAYWPKLTPLSMRAAAQRPKRACPEHPRVTA